MIDVREAVHAAVKFAREVYGKELIDARLEEVELTEDRKFWLITLGVRLTTAVPAALAAVRSAIGGEIVDAGDREYKAFRVDANTAEVRSMKMRIVA
ncbi:MAG: hypothetical protein JOZ54_05560 [Acidobacteria bacterium]|nr:hypothetical protein [Acidobacteriota bacterium]